jgi:hypothetical protein
MTLHEIAAVDFFNNSGRKAKTAKKRLRNY